MYVAMYLCQCMHMNITSADNSHLVATNLLLLLLDCITVACHESISIFGYKNTVAT